MLSFSMLGLFPVLRWLARRTRMGLTKFLQLPTGDDTVCEIDNDVVLFPNSDVTQARVKSKILAASAA